MQITDCTDEKRIKWRREIAGADGNRKAPKGKESREQQRGFARTEKGRCAAKQAALTDSPPNPKCLLDTHLYNLLIRRKSGFVEFASFLEAYSAITGSQKK